MARTAGAVGTAATSAAVAAAALAATVTLVRTGQAARAALQTVRQARDTVQATHRLVLRADRVLAEVEEPLRSVAPRLARLARALDDPEAADLPETLRRVQHEVLPLLRGLADSRDRVTAAAAPAERVLSFVDEASRTLTGLPAAALLARHKPSARTVPGRVVPGQAEHTQDAPAADGAADRPDGPR